MDKQDKGNLLRRAFAAYFKTGGTGLPSATSDVRQYDGLIYICLEDEDGQSLAIYRLRNDGLLKRLKRWPKELTA